MSSSGRTAIRGKRMTHLPLNSIVCSLCLTPGMSTDRCGFPLSGRCYHHGDSLTVPRVATGTASQGTRDCGEGWTRGEVVDFKCDERIHPGTDQGTTSLDKVQILSELPWG